MTNCEYGAATDVGLMRSNNEDAYLGDPELGLWIVADGMGGHDAGEVASDLAQLTIKQEFSQVRDLAQAIHRSHVQILRAVDQGQGKHGMGSTVVAMVSSGSSYEIAWVGDSRAYLYSPAKPGQVTQLTTDHSYVQSLFKSGLIKREDMATHPDKNIITQCLGSTELDQIQVDKVKAYWQPGERILLCSDGLTDCVNDETIANLLSALSPPQEVAAALVQAALNGGGRDNVTVIVVDAPQIMESPWWQILVARLKQLFPNKPTQ